MKWILALYPASWQRRYRREVEAHLDEERPPRLRTSLDLMAGAVDAWTNPHEIPTSPEEKGDSNMITASRCHSTDFSKRDSLRSAGWMIGICLVLTATGLVLDADYGETVAVKALMNSAFFIALTISARFTYLKPYSPMARNVITLVAVPAWYGFFFAAGLLAEAI